ncbi:MAG: hypothetical protein HUU57_11845 [Bdellovibrio sp.]|nr:hypothetical protein [Bdellovibrio sp.]
MIVMFINFSLGFFGAIHTGILNSIASRNYAFETFRNRTDLTYFRNSGPVGVEFSKVKNRVHGTISEKQAAKVGKTDPPWSASSRLVDFMSFSNRAAEEIGNSKGEHAKTRELQEGRVSESMHQGVNPIWIKTTYGICLDSSCGAGS